MFTQWTKNRLFFSSTLTILTMNKTNTLLCQSYTGEKMEKLYRLFLNDSHVLGVLSVYSLSPSLFLQAVCQFLVGSSPSEKESAFSFSSG